MKKTEPSFSIRQILLLIIPALTGFYTVNPLPAQAQASWQSTPSGSQNQAPDASGNQTGIPALNIIPPPVRPPLPPPPETPQPGQAIVMQQGVPPSLPQAWRIKALQLFKANNSLDKASVMAARMQSGYSSAFEAIARALAKSGVTLEALSFSSGHMLISSVNESGLCDRAIIALRQAAPDSDSSASSGTDIRVFCDSHNRSLTLSQIKDILSQADLAQDGSQNKTGVNSL